MAIELTDLGAQEHKQAHSYHSQLHLPDVTEVLLPYYLLDSETCNAVKQFFLWVSISGDEFE